MIELETVLASVIASADGEIVGRVRLQKMIFLLQQQKFICDVPFRYHHYGPFSRKVDQAIDKAKALGIIKEELKQRSGDGADYSVFHSNFKAHQSGPFEDKVLFKNMLDIMKKHSSTVLELAATIYWLQHFECVGDWSDELVVRKGKKVENGRKEMALEALSELGLA